LYVLVVVRIVFLVVWVKPPSALTMVHVTLPESASLRNSQGTPISARNGEMAARHGLRCARVERTIPHGRMASFELRLSSAHTHHRCASGQHSKRQACRRAQSPVPQQARPHQRWPCCGSPKGCRDHVRLASCTVATVSLLRISRPPCERTDQCYGDSQPI